MILVFWKSRELGTNGLQINVKKLENAGEVDSFGNQSNLGSVTLCGPVASRSIPYLNGEIWKQLEGLLQGLYKMM